MRTVLICLAIAGAIVVVVGIAYTITWMIMVGVAALIVSLVMAAQRSISARRGH